MNRNVSSKVKMAIPPSLFRFQSPIQLSSRKDPDQIQQVDQQVHQQVDQHGQQ